MVKRRCYGCIPKRSKQSIITKPIDGQCPLPGQEYIKGYFRYTPKRKYVAPYCRFAPGMAELSVREMGYLDQLDLLPYEVNDLDILDHLLLGEASMLSYPYRVAIGTGLDKTLTAAGLAEIGKVNATVNAAKRECIATNFGKMPLMSSTIDVTAANEMIKVMNARTDLKTDDETTETFINAQLASGTPIVNFLKLLALSSAYYLGFIRGVLTNVPAVFGETKDSGLYKSSGCSLALLSSFGLLPIEGQGAECGLEKVSETKFVYGQNRSFIKFLVPSAIDSVQATKFEDALIECPLVYTFILKADGSVRTNAPVNDKDEIAVSKMPNADGTTVVDEMLIAPNKSTAAKYQSTMDDLFNADIQVASTIMKAMNSDIVYVINKDWCIGPSSEDIVLHHALVELPQLFTLTTQK